MQKPLVRMSLVLWLLPLGLAQAQGLTLGEALDAPELAWSTGSDAGIGGWNAQTAITHDGVDAAGKVIRDDPYSSWISTTVTGPVAVAFWWRTVNSNGNAALLFSIDSGGDPLHESAGVLHSSPGWSFANYAIPAGEHALYWILLGEPYIVGGRESYSEGQVDEVRLIPIAPRIGIRGMNGVLITNGTGAAAVAAGTDFGSAYWTDRTVSRTYAITNSGTTNLGVASVAVTGPQAGEFQVVSHPAMVPAGRASNLVVRFDPNGLGARAATITVGSDDPETPEYSFAVGGTGLADGGFLRVRSGAAAISNGSAAVTNALGTDFGTAYQTGENTTRTFVLTNAGNQVLSVSAVEFFGDHAGDFAALSFPASLAGGAQSNLQVRFDPEGTGPRRAEIRIASDSADGSPYIFAIGGQGLADKPYLVVRGANGSIITNGALAVSVPNGTHFGGAALNAAPVERMFSISNSGVVALEIERVDLEGSGAAWFDAPFFPAIVSPGTASNFSLRFTPGAAGAFTAVVAIANSDADRNPYRFAVRGEAQSTHYVWTNSPAPAPPYLTWDTAAHTIQDAVSIGVSGDVVRVADGVYDRGGDSGSRVHIGSAIRVQSENGPARASIVATQSIRGVYMAGGAVLAGFTVTGGGGVSFGGGVHVAQASGLVSNCILAGNAALFGGGIYGGLVVDCILADNEANAGGGASDAVLHRCRLMRNEAQGEYLDLSCLDWDLGGLMQPRSGADRGGGGAYQSSLHSCVLAENSARLGGGAVYSHLVNCTVVSNQATGVSGNLFGGGGMFGGSATNCVFAGNANPGVPSRADYDGGPVCEGGDSRSGPPSIAYSCLASPPPGAGNVTGTVTFLPGTYRLQAGSSGLDAGLNAAVQGSADVAGRPRIFGGGVDMGAYEYQGPGTDGYWEWAAGLPGGGTGPGDSGSGDGYPNLLKYATGGSATEPDRVADMEWAGADGVPRLLFRRNTNATDVALIVEGADSVETSAVWRGIATNLGGIWLPPVVAEEGSGNPVTCTAADPEPLASNRFLRLRVILP